MNLRKIEWIPYVVSEPFLWALNAIEILKIIIRVNALRSQRYCNAKLLILSWSKR